MRGNGYFWDEPLGEEIGGEREREGGEFLCCFFFGGVVVLDIGGGGFVGTKVLVGFISRLGEWEGCYILERKMRIVGKTLRVPRGISQPILTADEFLLLLWLALTLACAA